MPYISKWRSYSDEQLQQIVQESTSYQDLAERLGYSRNAGGTQKSLRNMVKEKNFDVSHFKGQAWNRGNYDYSSFTYGSKRKPGGSFTKAQIAIRGHQCECCKNTEWMGKPLNLEVHHVNGDRSDNRFENLQLLCPNCHSYTSTFAGKSRKIHVSDDDFISALKENSTIHGALIQQGLTPVGGNYIRARELIYKHGIQHLM